MKTFLILIAICLSQTAIAQQKPIQILFDVTSNDTLTHQSAYRHVSLMAKSYPESKLEVVIYGGALPMVVRGQSTVEQGILKLAENKNVAFKVCRVTMKKYQVTEDQLIAGVQVVPDAIIELVVKQGEGWGYIKEAQ